MGRERLERLLGTIWEHRLGLVIALAGSGKTTLLTQFTETVDVPVAWYCADADDASVERLLHGIGAALAQALGRPPESVASVEDLVGMLDAIGRTVLVVDDFHTIRGTPAEEAIGRIIAYSPPTLKTLIASRSYPSFDVSRLRVSGELLEVGADDLRFRSWEVERLFRDFYGSGLQPEDLAVLTRRTEGWAAGLQLFHLATRGKPRNVRRHVIAALSSRSRIAHDYLARNMLDGLGDELRSFVLRTSVLAQLTGELCDELLDRSGSGELLAHLAQNEIFTVSLIEGGYRYHEALRSHLQSVLVEEITGAEARALYRRAAVLMQEAGAMSAALSAYCRAEAWDLAERILSENGEQLAAHGGSWLDTLPAALLDQDPWLLLATARRYTALGCPQKAMEAYRRAEDLFGGRAPGVACRRERRALAAWVEPASYRGTEWLGLVRSALEREPQAVARQAAAHAGAPGRLVEGVVALLSCRPADASRILLSASEAPDASPLMAVVCRLLAAVASVAGAPLEPGEIELLAEEADLLDAPLLARLCRSALVLEGSAGLPEAEAAYDTCRHEGDAWSASIVGFVYAVGALREGRTASGWFEVSAEGFHRLGAHVAEAWARSGHALALAVEGNGDAAGAARAAEERARVAGVRGLAAQVVAALASSAAEARPAVLQAAQDLAAGQRWPSPEQKPSSRAATVPVTASRPFVLRCFGGFRLEVGGRTIDPTSVKPRCRSALHILALHAGRPVHRESLLDALWPSSPPQTGIRNLHVAISTLRQLLEPGAHRGEPSLLVRAGDAYQLALPQGADVDIESFETELAAARRARADGDDTAAREALERCRDAYGGDLLPEDGPSEWVVKHRERFRMDATDAAQALATIQMASQEFEATAVTCEWGLRIDPYRDGLWRMLIRAHGAGGQLAAAEQARRSYRQVMRELGLPAPRSL